MTIELDLFLAGGPEELVTAGARAGALLEAMQEPFALGGLAVQVDARIAMYPDHRAHPEELLSRAEAALMDERSGADRIKMHDPAADIRGSDDGWLIDDLAKAFEAAGELICHYQPKLSARDEHVHSVEALVRWRHPIRARS